MADQFSSTYTDLLDGLYDCVDRIVINAYFQFVCGPGGFRIWWRNLYGNDDNLDTAHLMRMAGKFSRCLRAWAKANSIPVLDCTAKERKHETGEELIPPDANKTGVFAILVARATAPLWDVKRSKNGHIVDLYKKKNMPYVNHYYFHIMDAEWGHITIRMCGHPPFSAMIILNGHEYVERLCRKQNIPFRKEGNCFIQVPNAARLGIAADTLCSTNAIGLLIRVCERWIYSSCLCFALSMAEQEKSGFQYSFSVFQTEYSRNLLFKIGRQMEYLFQSVINHTRSSLHVKTIKTIFGHRYRPSRSKTKPYPRLETVVEKPDYDLTVLKIHFGKLTAKIYSKGEHVLRIEVIAHNTKALKCRRSLTAFANIVGLLKGILNRFMDILQAVDAPFIPDHLLDDMALPSQLASARIAGIDINKPRIRAVAEAVLQLAASPYGFKSSEIAAIVPAKKLNIANEYTARQAAYDLKKLLAKNILSKTDRSRRYQVVPEKLRYLVALLVIREKVIKPVLAGAGEIKRGPKPKNILPINAHYHALQMEMHNLFRTIKIAA